MNDAEVIEEPSTKMFEDEFDEMNTSIVVNEGPTFSPKTLNTLIVEVSRFSNYNRLIRTMAYVLRFISSVKTKERHQSDLTVEELERAEHRLCLMSQSECFNEDIMLLKSTSPIPHTSRVFHLQPFIDSAGTMRANCRLDESDLPHNEKYPIIISAESRIVRLLICNIHQNNCHVGELAVRTLIRNNFWLLKARQAIKTTIFNDCMTCKRNRISNYGAPPAPLPNSRVQISFNRAFHLVGVDYVGPFIVKQSVQLEKCYVLVICCCLTRALHFEVTRSMDKISTQRALEIFMYRRGICQHIYSDNAKCFQAIATYFQDKYHIRWTFNTPKAPWHGGHYERMMPLLKNPIKATFKKVILNYEVFCVIVAKLEAIANCRPITALTTNPNDPKPLTPSDFLIGGCLLARPDSGQPLHDNLLKKDLVEVVDNNRRIFSRLRERWRKEYLRFLALSNKKYSPFQTQVGDVVLLESSGSKHLWPLGIITNLLPSRDGKVRSVQIYSENRTLVRPIQLLYRLESVSAGGEC